MFVWTVGLEGGLSGSWTTDTTEHSTKSQSSSRLQTWGLRNVDHLRKSNFFLVYYILGHFLQNEEAQ